MVGCGSVNDGWDNFVDHVPGNEPGDWQPTEPMYVVASTRTGVALAFSEWDAFAGVDLDDCLDSDGQFTWGQEIVTQLDSYYEISPSGRGVKLFLRGTKPASAQCRVDGQGDKGIGKLEIYDKARCFAVTGRWLDQSPADVMPRQEQLESLCNRYWPASNGLVTTRPINPIETSMHAKAQACFQAMSKMQIVDHSDGSHRLFSVCCRCVEFDLSDSDAVLAIRKYEAIAPFPRHWSDAEIY